MSITVPAVMFGWIPVILILFALLPARRAAIASFLLAWMFLPAVEFEVPGLPNYSKVTATSLGVLLGTLLFDFRRLLAFRPHWLDIPMLLWCLCPYASSITNGLGAYDGLSAIAEHTLIWGVPYLLGRVHLRDLDALRELALGLFVGGLVYVPLCLWEIRMSPQLNLWVYGFGGAGIEYATELGKFGSRPRVFMGSALVLGLFMTSAALVGVWLWASGVFKRLGGVSAGPLVALLVVTTLLCKNVGGLALLVMGLVVFAGLRWFRTALPVYLLILAIPTYMLVRSTATWSGESMVKLVRSLHQRRAESLETRLIMEDRLAGKALQKPLYGWGRWGRSRVTDEGGRDISLTDGRWVIVLGMTGITGLVAFSAALLLPALFFLRRCRSAARLHPAAASAMVLLTLVVLYAVDSLVNATISPLFVVAGGGLVTLAALQGAAESHRRHLPRNQPLAANAGLLTGRH